MICVFVAGVAVGAMGAVGVMKRLGYSKPGEERPDEQEGDRRDRGSEPADVELPEEDKPSFVKPNSMNTSKVKYHIPSKPDLEELAKKYQDESFTEHLAENEHPEDDPPEEDEDPLEAEMADAMQDHPGQYEDDEMETDGFGHVIMQLPSKRPDDLIFLVKEDWSGEIYPIEDLRWFEGDDVVVDITDTPVDDVDHVIGSALEHFGECGSPDIVCVRNATIGFEYEVTRVGGSFGAYIYGVDDDEATLPERKGGSHPAKARKKKRDEEGEGGVAL